MQEVATLSSEKLGRALYVRDDAWSHGYLKGLERMRDYVILNPQKSSKALEEHLRVVDLKDLEFDLAALNHVGEIGRVMIPNEFLLEDDDPSDQPFSKGCHGIHAKLFVRFVLVAGYVCIPNLGG